MIRQTGFFWIFILFFCGVGNVDAADQAKARLSEYTPPLFEDFSAMVKRPLFLASRRPVSFVKHPAARPPAPKREVSTAKINLLLSGVIHDGEEYIALVRKGKKGELIQLRKNKMIDGWRLLEIKQEEITLNKGASFTTVRLRDNKPADVGKRKALRAAKIKAEKLRKLRQMRKKKKAMKRASNRKG